MAVLLSSLVMILIKNIITLAIGRRWEIGSNFGMNCEHSYNYNYINILYSAATKWTGALNKESYD